MVLAGPSAPQTRLVALIAASGNRSLPGGSSSSGKKRGSGTDSADDARIEPLAFGVGRGVAPILITINADNICTVFDPDGLSKQWTVNEVLRVAEAMPNIRLPFAAASPAPTLLALDRAVFEGRYKYSTTALVDADVADGNRGFLL